MSAAAKALKCLEEARWKPVPWSGVWGFRPDGERQENGSLLVGKKGESIRGHLNPADYEARLYKSSCGFPLPAVSATMTVNLLPMDSVVQVVRDSPLTKWVPGYKDADGRDKVIASGVTADGWTWAVHDYVIDMGRLENIYGRSTYFYRFMKDGSFRLVWLSHDNKATQWKSKFSHSTKGEDNDISAGYWEIRPAAGGKTEIKYHIATDTGASNQYAAAPFYLTIQQSIIEEIFVSLVDEAKKKSG